MSCTMIAEERMEKFDLYPEPRSTGILRFCVLVLVMAASTLSVIAQSNGVAQLNLDVTRIVSPISPTLYGLMTEEINHSYDGGLYADALVAIREKISTGEFSTHVAYLADFTEDETMLIFEQEIYAEGRIVKRKEEFPIARTGESFLKSTS